MNKVRLFYHATVNNSAAVLQQAVARMLFWGQQGVSPNIQKAVRHYERGAVQWEDPVSMYDYGIVLLQVGFTVFCTVICDPPLKEYQPLWCCYRVLFHII